VPQNEQLFATFANFGEITEGALNPSNQLALREKVDYPELPQGVDSFEHLSLPLGREPKQCVQSLESMNW
jgi:hypothetical protein